MQKVVTKLIWQQHLHDLNFEYLTSQVTTQSFENVLFSEPCSIITLQFPIKVYLV